MKKVFAIVMLLAIVVASMSMLVACNNSASASANFEVPEGGYDGSEVTITFYHTMGAKLQGVLNNYIKEFNNLYPNIHIEHTQQGDYDGIRKVISTELAAGKQPNIAYCYPDHVALYNVAGAVVQLDNLINSTETVTHGDGTTEILGLTDEQKADFIEGYYNEGKAFGDDFMYCMPFSKSTEVLYYNKTYFDENNLTVPTTWAEMKALCQKIKQLDPNSIPLGYDSEANWFITMCEQYGSGYTSSDEDNHFLFNNDKNKEFVREIASWYQEGLFTTKTLLGGYTSDLFTNLDAESRSYMSIGSSAGANYQVPDPINNEYPFEVGVAMIPQVDASNPKVISQGPSVCIFAKENPQEVIASWLFVKFLTTSVEFQAEYSMASGYVPVLKSVKNNEVYKEFMASADGGANIAASTAKICMDQESAYYVSPAFNGSSAARDEVGNLLCACLADGANIDKLFADAIEECEYQVF